MALSLFTDFSDYSLGDIQSQGWTARYVTSALTSSILADAGATGGKLLRYERSGSNRKALTWDAFSSDADRADFEIVARMRTLVSPGSGSLRCGAAGRITGRSGSESCYAGLIGLAGDNRRINEYTAGTSAALATQSWTGYPDAGDWFCVRFRCETAGSDAQLRLKMWIGDAGDEPGGWDVDYLDTSPRSIGELGIYNFYGGVEVDWIGAATGGGTAPTSAGGDEPDVVGSGHQVTYGEGSVAQKQPAAGAGHQTGYATGEAAQLQPASGDGHQAGYGLGAAVQRQPASGSGHQTSYGAGEASSEAPSTDVSGSGHQTSYGAGSAAQNQPASGDGHQTVYGSGEAAQAQPAGGAGHQVSYGEGAAFTQRSARGSGHQVSYGAHRPPRVTDDRPAGGWGFLNDYERERQRRERERRRRAQLIERAERIQSDLDRDLARALQAREAEEDERREHRRLRALAERYQGEIAAEIHGDRIARAFVRAAEQGNYSALQALDRELSRLREEEMFLMQAAVIVLQNEGYVIA